MKKIAVVFVVFISFIGCKSVDVFNLGEVRIDKTTEKIAINYSQTLPLVKVEINGKEYNFLFDTGAPTVISSEVYNSLALKPAFKSYVSDSQKNTKKQIFTIIPDMKVGDLAYKNIGCVVMDLKDFEFKCIGIDGILGANQMAHSVWKIDYLNGFAEISSDLSSFDVSEYDYIIPFSPKPQKTPVIEFETFNQKRKLTFDTGYGGRLKMNNDELLVNEITNIEKYKISGITSVGAYGGGNYSIEYCFKTDEINLGGIIFSDEIIETGKSNLIGNEFLEDFVFVMDWKSKKIYLKRVRDKKDPEPSFGIGTRYIDDKLEVVVVINKENNPLQLGDIITEINGKSFENLLYEKQCENYLKGLEKEANVIVLTIRREDSIYKFTIEKKLFFE